MSSRNGLTLPTMDELKTLTTEQLIENLRISVPNDFFYNLDNATGVNSVIKGICPNGHEYVTTIGKKLRAPQCVICDGEKQREKKLAAVVRSWHMVLEGFTVVNGYDVRNDIFDIRQLNKPMVLRCSNNHEFMTTMLDVMDATDALKTRFCCPTCSEEEESSIMKLKFTDWLHDINNGWKNSTVYFDPEILPVDDSHTVTVVCGHGHKTTDTMYNLMRLTDCPVCTELKRIEDLPKAMIGDRISNRTRMTELYHADKHENSLPCERGHVKHNGECGICLGHDHIHHTTLIPYLSQVTDSKYLFETNSDVIGIHDEITVFCRNHGVFVRTADELSQNQGCHYCQHDIDGVRDSLYVFRDRSNSYFMGVSSSVSNHKQLIEQEVGEVELVTLVNGMKTGALLFLLDSLRLATSHLRPDTVTDRFNVDRILIINGAPYGELEDRIDPFIKSIKRALNDLHALSDSPSDVRLTFPIILTKPYL